MGIFNMNPAAYYIRVAYGLMAVACQWTFATGALAGSYDFAVDPSMAIGAGFDTIQLQVMGDCVKRTLAKPNPGATGQTITFALQHIESYESLVQTLSLSAAASVKLAVGGAEGRVKLARSITINEYSIYAIASVLVENAPRRMRNVKLTDEASRVLAERGPQAFRTMCGDDFIVGFITGGEYRALIEIKTRSEGEKSSISGSLAGSYKVFNGSSEFEQVLTRIASTNQIQVYTYQSGGNGQVIAIDPNTMIKTAINFPKVVNSNQARPIAALTHSYLTIETPNGPGPIDTSIQQEIIASLAALGNAYTQRINNVTYILGNLQEFINPNSEQLTQALNVHHKNLNKIQASARSCYRSISECFLPTDFEEISYNLPQRHQKITDFCKNPVYTTKTDPLCGIDKFNIGRGEVCGAEIFREGRGGVCGAEKYNTGTGPACGVDTYAQGTDFVCGEKVWAYGDHLAADFVRRDCEFRRNRYVPPKSCASPETCRHQNFGPETYKKCEHESFGIDKYKTCRDKSFGVEKYAQCENETFGVASYKTCANEQFGFLRCDD